MKSEHKLAHGGARGSRDSPTAGNDAFSSLSVERRKLEEIEIGQG